MAKQAKTAQVSRRLHCLCTAYTHAPQPRPRLQVDSPALPAFRPTWTYWRHCRGGRTAGVRRAVPGSCRHAVIW